MKTRTLTLGLMTLGLFAMSVQAETRHCHTIEDCQKLKAEVEADLAELLKDVTPELTGILKTGITQYEAEKICQNEGMRLPTARELALVEQSLGAQGVSETKKDGYELVKGSDIMGNPDHFYFSHKGYKRPGGELGNRWFWTSSVHPDYSDSDDYDSAYVTDGVIGDFDILVRGDAYLTTAVRCVRSR